MAKKMSRTEILAAFFDEGVYTPLFADGAVSAAFGSATGQSTYAICQNGDALTVKDAQKTIKVLEMAVQTGNPVVTFYDSIGANLSQGADVLAVSARTMAAVSKASGVVPQIAVIIGTCGASAALTAAAADVCIMAKDAQLFFTPPFVSAAAGDKNPVAGTAAAAVEAGVAALVTETAELAVEKAARLIGMLPANNLSAGAVFEYAEPSTPLDLTAYDARKAVNALADSDSVLELFEGYGSRIVTAFATVQGNTAGILATGTEPLCDASTQKAARFVRLCDAFSIPVISVVNSEGFVRSTTADIAGGLRSAARMASTLADATTVKIAVLAGKAIGPVYTAFADADLRIAVQGCTVGAVDPAVAVSVLNKEEIDASDNIIAATKAAAARYAAEVCSADACVAAGIADMAVSSSGVRAAVISAMDMLVSKRVQRLAKKHGNMAL